MRRRQCGSLFWEASTSSSSDTFPVFRSSPLLLHLFGDRAPLDCRNARIFHGVDGDPLSFCSFSCTCFPPSPLLFFSKAVAAHDDNSQDEEAEKYKNDQMPSSDALPVFPSPPKASVSHINFRKEKGGKIVDLHLRLSAADDLRSPAATNNQSILLSFFGTYAYSTEKEGGSGTTSGVVLVSRSAEL